MGRAIIFGTLPFFPHPPLQGPLGPRSASRRAAASDILGLRGHWKISGKVREPKNRLNQECRVNYTLTPERLEK